MEACALNPNLGGGGEVILPLPPCLFSLNISEMVKAVNPGILQYSVTFHRDIHAKFGSLLVPVSRYWGKLRWGYFRFPDFWSVPYLS